jgi:hypothetical protein
MMLCELPTPMSVSGADADADAEKSVFAQFRGEVNRWY